jgi:ABC-type multidrug transport system ATPase subunit
VLPAFELDSLTHRFPGPIPFSSWREKTVLRSLTLTLPGASTLGVAGPNGSGKSTLLDLLAGIATPSSGTLRVLGGSPRAAAIRRRIGHLPEDSPFPPELSAREALELCGSLSRLPRATLRASSAAMLARVGLASEARTRLGRYSRGMLRRFGLAQACLHAPDLLLLDEPTAGLDAQGFEVLEDLLAEARVRGASIVLTSHLAGELERHADQLAVLVEGRLVADGPPGVVLAGRTLLEVYRSGAPRAAEPR